MRRRAAWVLGVIGDNSAVPALIETLMDYDHETRGLAAGALGDIGDDAAVPALIKALKDGSPWVMTHAEAALVEIGKPAVPALKAAHPHRKHCTVFYCYFCRALRQLGAE